MVWYNPFSLRNPFTWLMGKEAPADATRTLASAGQRHQEQADDLQYKRGAERG